MVISLPDLLLREPALRTFFFELETGFFGVHTGQVGPPAFIYFHMFVRIKKGLLTFLRLKFT